MISVSGVTKTHGGRRILDHLSFDVEKGSCTGIFDADLGGHKILLRILATLTPPSAGQVSIGGIDVVRNPLRARRHISYVSAAAPEIYASGQLRVREYLWMVLCARGIANQLRAREAATELGLNLDERIARLNAQDAWLLAMATAIGVSPDVILFELPRCAAAPSIHAALARLIRAAIENGAAAVGIAEEPQYLVAVADRILLLENGCLKAPPAEIVSLQ
jgi:ABC-2 type transport system ATP-binding protein